MKYSANISSLKSHNGFEYDLEAVIVHVGETASSGHYVLHLPKYRYLFDRNKFIQCDHDFSNDVYMAIYKKKLPEAPETKTRKHNAPPSSAGIYMEINDKLEQNADRTFKIASVVKLMTYLVCEKLRLRLGIPLNPKFKIPKTEVYGLNVVLTEGDEVSLQTLYELMLIISSADAAASLAIIFGDLLKKQYSDLVAYNPEVIFVKEMLVDCRMEMGMMDTVIKDACGIKPSLSTIHDLKLLLKFVYDNK